MRWRTCHLGLSLASFPTAQATTASCCIDARPAALFQRRPSARSFSPPTMSTIPVDASPSHPLDQQPTIGLIGMGAMGTMYARLLSDAGWKKCVPSSHRLLNLTPPKNQRL